LADLKREKYLWGGEWGLIGGPRSKEYCYISSGSGKMNKKNVSPKDSTLTQRYKKEKGKRN